MALGVLTPTMRAVLLARAVEGLSSAEVAERFGYAGPAVVDQTMWRIRKCLGAHFGPEGARLALQEARAWR